MRILHVSIIISRSLSSLEYFKLSTTIGTAQPIIDIPNMLCLSWRTIWIVSDVCLRIESIVRSFRTRVNTCFGSISKVSFCRVLARIHLHNRIFGSVWWPLLFSISTESLILFDTENGRLSLRNLSMLSEKGSDPSECGRLRESSRIPSHCIERIIFHWMFQGVLVPLLYRFEFFT